MVGVSLPIEREAVETRLSLGELSVEIMKEHTEDERIKRNKEARKRSVEVVMRDYTKEACG